MLKKFLIIYAGSNPYYLSVILDLILDNSGLNREYLFLDLTTSRKNRHRNANFHTLLVSKGVQVLKQSKTPPGVKSLEFWWEKNSDDSAIVALEQSLISAMVTFTRDEHPKVSLRHRLRKNKLRKEALAAGKLIYETILDNSVTDIFIPNGRFPYQTIASLISRKLGVNEMFFEQGEQGPSSYFLEKFKTLDRIETQLALSNRIKNGFTKNELEVANNWYQSRMLGHNIFGRLWTKGGAISGLETSKRAVIFSSSEDEYAELGQEWKTHDWVSQWAAIEAVSRYLIDQGYQVTLRIHPNIVSKSHASFKRNIRNQNILKSALPQINILGHESDVDSYKLIESSEMVIVWNSTIGLESTYLGKPTLCLTSAFYDELVDVTKCHNIQEIQKALHNLNSPDPQKAVLFRAALNARDHWMRRESELLYAELLKRQFTSKISRFVKIPDLSISASLWIDLLRHRSPANSFRLAKKYLGRGL